MAALHAGKSFLASKEGGEMNDEDREVLRAYHARKQERKPSRSGDGIDWLSVVFILLALALVAGLNIAGVW